MTFISVHNPSQKDILLHSHLNPTASLSLPPSIVASSHFRAALRFSRFGSCNNLLYDRDRCPAAPPYQLWSRDSHHRKSCRTTILVPWVSCRRLLRHSRLARGSLTHIIDCDEQPGEVWRPRCGLNRAASESRGVCDRGDQLCKRGNTSCRRWCRRKGYMLVLVVAPHSRQVILRIFPSSVTLDCAFATILSKTQPLSLLSRDR